jgi:hypothetical protein
VNPSQLEPPREGTDAPSAVHATDAARSIAETEAARLRRARRTAAWMRALTWAVTLFGLVAFALLWHQLGSRALLEAAHVFGRLWPGLLLLEGARLVCELVGTRVLLGAAHAHVPWRRLVRGQLLGQALDVVMPAGRTASEAAKAAVYSRAIGLPQAAAIATALQLAVLACNALWVFAGYCVSGRLGLPEALRVGLLGYALATGLLVVAATLVAAAPRVRRWLSHVRVLYASLERFAQLLVAAPAALTSAVVAQLMGRGVQVLQLAVAAGAFGVHFSPLQFPLAQSVYLVGAALGDLVPAQVGTTDAALVMAGPALGLTPAAAFSVIVALRAVQLSMAAMTAMVAWVMSRLEPVRHTDVSESRPASPTVVKLPQRF